MLLRLGVSVPGYWHVWFFPEGREGERDSSAGLFKFSYK